MLPVAFPSPQAQALAYSCNVLIIMLMCRYTCSDIQCSGWLELACI